MDSPHNDRINQMETDRSGLRLNLSRNRWLQLWHDDDVSARVCAHVRDSVLQSCIVGRSRRSHTWYFDPEPLRGSQLLPEFFDTTFSVLAVAPHHDGPTCSLRQLRDILTILLQAGQWSIQRGLMYFEQQSCRRLRS